MKTCLIIGVNSFTGFYVGEAFKKNGYNVVGTALSKSNEKCRNVSTIYKMNILNYDNISDVLQKVQPDIVVHFAGVSFVISDEVSQFYDVHIIGTRNLLAALAEHNIPVSKVILASSGQVYGHASHPAETTETLPVNDYAVSKLAMEYMAKLWSDKLPILITRPFNCVGIGQAEHFLVPKILSAFVSQRPEVELGQIDLARDFLDIRFAAECYLALAEEGQVGETYNISSGKSNSIAYIIKVLSYVSSFSVKIKQNIKFVRQNDPLSIAGDNSKIMKLKKAPKPIPLEETLKWMYYNANRN